MCGVRYVCDMVKRLRAAPRPVRRCGGSVRARPQATRRPRRAGGPRWRWGCRRPPTQPPRACVAASDLRRVWGACGVRSGAPGAPDVRVAQQVDDGQRRASGVLAGVALIVAVLGARVEWNELDAACVCACVRAPPGVSACADGRAHTRSAHVRVVACVALCAGCRVACCRRRCLACVRACDGGSLDFGVRVEGHEVVPVLRKGLCQHEQRGGGRGQRRSWQRRAQQRARQRQSRSLLHNSSSSLRSQRAVKHAHLRPQLIQRALRRGRAADGDARAAPRATRKGAHVEANDERVQPRQHRALHCGVRAALGWSGVKRGGGAARTTGAGGVATCRSQPCVRVVVRQRSRGGACAGALSLQRGHAAAACWHAISAHAAGTDGAAAVCVA